MISDQTSDKTMANDREVLKVVWEGKVPMKFVAEDDLESQECDLFFLLVPRVTYFPLIIDKASDCVTFFCYCLL